MKEFATLREAERVIVLRTDAIGDNVLGSALLRPLRAALPHAKIVYACQDRAADLFAACGIIDEAIPFSRGRAYSDEIYREDVARKLGAVKADALLNPVYTREPLADALVARAGAHVRIGFAGAGVPGCRDDAYTHLVPRGQEWMLELERCAQFLSALGITGSPLESQVWLTAEDESFASDIFSRREPDAPESAQTIILFGGALADYRVNHNVGLALATVFSDGAVRVISVGAAHEYALHEELLREYPGQHLNLCGRTTLRQTAALLKKAMLAVGAETGAAHLACAVGTRNVVVLGGGHFGRFMPWSPLTTAVCLPLACFRCDWKCRFSKAHCVVDIQAETIAAGIRAAMTSISGKPQLMAQRDLPQLEMDLRVSPALPVIADVRQFIDASGVEIVHLNSPRDIGPGDRRQRAVVSTSNHRDNSRQRHLRSHLQSSEGEAIKISAIIPIVDDASSLRVCLADLTGLSQFAARQLEILVVVRANHGSASQLIEEFQARVGLPHIRCVEAPIGEARYESWNRAIDLARGEFLTIADSQSSAKMITALVAALQARSDCVLAYVDSDASCQEFDRIRLFQENMIGAYSVWRRKVHQQIGYFDTNLSEAGEYEFWLRLAMKWPFVPVASTAPSNTRNLSNDDSLMEFEAQACRQRYWRSDWGAIPSCLSVTNAFQGLANRIKSLPSAARVAIFGAGQHTTKNIAGLRMALEPHVRLVAVLDDQPGGAIDGLPIVPAESWQDLGIRAIVVSSDMYERAMTERAKALTRSAVPILTIYRAQCGYLPSPEHGALPPALPGQR